MKLLWLSDIHLDHVDPVSLQIFYEKLRSKIYDATVITGDISTSRLLPVHLDELARACAPRRLFFVLGNHDFYGSGFAQVDQVVDECCRVHPNLQHLGQGETIRLSPTTALVGHRGWADGRAWGGKWTALHIPDRVSIRDLRSRSAFDTLQRMKSLGKSSGSYFRKLLPRALASYQHVVIATHVPPFARAVRFDSRACEATKLPHYVNASAGGVIKGIGVHFPKTKITVLCGHTHHATVVRIAENIEVRAGQARKGNPTIQGVIESP